MRSLISSRRPSAARRRDPAPSRIAFRIKRHWRSGLLRRVATIWLPAAVVIGAAAWVILQPDLRAASHARMMEMKDDLSSRPEFAIRKLNVIGANAEVTAEIRALLSGYVGSSSLTADVNGIRRDVTAIGWIESARVRLSAPETLIVSVDIRTPAAIWRHQGDLTLVDEAGAEIAPIETRAERADLPVIAGLGANRAVDEAREIIKNSGALSPHLRGLVRIGERRWNLILQDRPKVLLPADDPLAALGYLVSLEDTKALTGRDLTSIDLRLDQRPTLRLSPEAVETLTNRREPPKKPGEKV